VGHTNFDEVPLTYLNTSFYGLIKQARGLEKLFPSEKTQHTPWGGKK
jgi:hypothetical protein